MPFPPPSQPPSSLSSARLSSGEASCGEASCCEALCRDDRAAGEPGDERQLDEQQLDVEATRLSAMLQAIASDDSRERIAVGDLLAAMRERAFGPLMLVFALPNVLPAPPGTSSILGAPLIFLTAQLAFGRSPWLPRLIAARSIPRSDFARFVDKAVPWLARVENLLRPRWGALARPPGENLVGLICLVLAIVLVLPIPLGNMLPALAICILGLGILERDGLWILAGAATAVASLGVVSGVVFAFAKAGLYLLKSFVAGF